MFWVVFVDRSSVSGCVVHVLGGVLGCGCVVHVWAVSCLAGSYGAL